MILTLFCGVDVGIYCWVGYCEKQENIYITSSSTYLLICVFNDAFYGSICYVIHVICLHVFLNQYICL